MSVRLLTTVGHALHRCSLLLVSFSKPSVEKLWRQMMKLPRDFLEA